MRICQSFRAGWTAGLALGLVVVGGPVAAAEFEKYLPNDTALVWSLNIRQVLDSPLAKKHALTEIKSALKGNDEMQKVLDALGFDPLRDANRVIFASPGLGAPDKWVAIVQGRFDLEKFHTKAKEVAKQQGGILSIQEEGAHEFYEVVVPGQAQAMFVALLNKDTLIGASGKEYVFEALDKAAGKKQPGLKKELCDLLAKADSKQSLSMATLSEAIRNGPLADNNDAKEIAGKIKNASGGITIGDDLRASFVVAAKDPDGAKEVAEKISNGLNLAKGIVSLQSQTLKELEPLVEFLDSLKIATQGASVTLKGQVSKELIEKSLKKE